MLNKLIKKAASNPKLIFLIDGIGALVTAIFLGIVLVKFEGFFGIPSSILYPLAVIPFIYIAYDYYCYRKAKSEIGHLLKGIAFMNLLYCVLSLALTFYHKEHITMWGWMYIIGEIVIIVSISIFELTVSKKLRANYS